MLRDGGEAGDVGSRWGSPKGRALPSGDRIFLFFSWASLGSKGQSSDPGALGTSHRDQTFPGPWLVSLPWSEIQFAKISPGLGYGSLASSLWLPQKPAPPLPVSCQISWMKLILFKPLTPMQLRAVGPVDLFFSQLSPPTDKQCPLTLRSRACVYMYTYVSVCLCARACARMRVSSG